MNIQTTNSRESTPNRVIAISGSLNFRDLGGYPASDGKTTKWGKVYRSAQLDRLSDEGISTLAKLDIKTVVDLRFTEETQRYPTIQSAVSNAEMLSWHEEWLKEQTASEAAVEENSKTRSQPSLAEQHATEMRLSWRESLASNDPDAVREAMRTNYPVKLYSHAKIYRRMLVRLAEGNTPLVFHCAAGKDRTGVAAALILSLLGVSDDVIIEDYMLTQELIEGRMESWLAGGAADSDKYQDFQSQMANHSADVLAPIFRADRAYIETLLDYVNSQYNGFDNYAREKLNLDAGFTAELKNALLE